jgi:hypothetical protein
VVFIVVSLLFDAHEHEKALLSLTAAQDGPRGRLFGFYLLYDASNLFQVALKGDTAI